MSIFGVLPNEKNKTTLRIFNQDCAARLFHNQILRDGAFGSSTKELKSDDVLFFLAPKQTNQKNDRLKEYLECFCYPLLPDESWKKLTLYEPDDKTWATLCDGYIGPVNKWQVAEVVAGEITGLEWYVMVCCLRFVFENPRVIEALFKARDLGLNLTECWVYAMYSYTMGSHTFLHVYITRTEEKKLANLNIPRDLQRLLLNKDIVGGEQNTIISRCGKVYRDINQWFLTQYPGEVIEREVTKKERDWGVTGKTTKVIKPFLSQEQYLTFCNTRKEADAAHR